MRCTLVLCAAALVGISTAGWSYGGVRYSGQQIVEPVRYYLPSSMNSGHQQMYVPRYYQPQVAAAYPVRQTPAYHVRPMVVPDQVEDVPIINVDMDFSPTFTYPGAMHVDKQTSFASRSGSVSGQGSGTKVVEDYLKIDAAIRANLKTLTDINNANLTTSEMEKIFGLEFQSRIAANGCSFWGGIGCLTSIGWAVPGCAISIYNPIAIVKCVTDLIGVGNECASCVCYVVEKLTGLDVPGC